MAVFKATLVFELNSWGWTESYLYNATGENHEAVMEKALNLAKRRGGLLGRGAAIKAVRVSQDGVGPDAYLVYTDVTYDDGAVTSQGTKTVSDDPPVAHPDIAVLCRMHDTTFGKHKFVYLRGIPDTISDNGGRYNHDKDWKNRMARFFQQLTDNPWGWSGVVSSVKKVPLNSITTNEDGTVDFEFKKNIFPTELVANGTHNTRVRIAKVNGGKSTANGHHIVTVISEQRGVTVQPLAIGPQRLGGYGTFNVYGFCKIHSCADQKIVTREAGAPLLQSRGRQKARPRS